jgi:hypothetical protein
VIASDHVSTELRAVCTADVPLPFQQEAPHRAVAEIDVEDVGATIESTDAHATLREVTLAAASGIDDFAFAESMEMDLVTPGREAARVAELAPVPAGSPFVAPGDPDVDLVDYLTAERLTVRVALTGAVPDRPFAAAMSACIDVEGIVVDDE